MQMVKYKGVISLIMEINNITGMIYMCNIFSQVYNFD